MTTKKKFRLKGHESFFIREGWLNKGLELVKKDPKVFSDHGGADEFGVGTNMAKAIRYWLKVCGFIQESPKLGAVLTPLGKYIYQFDPYLEDEFSLWLAHIEMVSKKELCTVWYLFFQEFLVEEFTKDQLYVGISRELEVKLGVTDFASRSLMDDCTVLLSTYAKGKKVGVDPEDKKISPFTRLGLLRKNGEIYERTKPNLENVDKLLILYMVQGYFQKEGQISVSIDYLEKGIFMPGKVMNLKRTAIVEYLEQLSDEGLLMVNRTAGLDMVYKSKNLTPIEIMEQYYKRMDRQ